MASQKKSIEKKTTETNLLKFDYALLILFLAFIAVFTISKINGEDDIFWHLSTGKYIMETKSVPSTDVFGFVTQGMPWIPFEWLWDVVVYNIFSASGFGGLYFFNAVLILLIFYVLFVTLKKFNYSVPYILIFLIILSLGIRYRLEIKPHIISYLCFVLILYFIINYKYLGKNVKKLFFIPAIFLLWTNVHMSVFAGITLLFIFLVNEVYIFLNKEKFRYYDIKIPDKKELMLIVVVFILSGVTLLINPNGINTITYTISHLNMKMLDTVYEWMSPFHPNFSGKLYNLIYISFLISGILVIYYSYKRKDFLPLMLFAMFVIYSFRALRFTVDFQLVTFIFIVMSVSFILRGKKKIFDTFNESKPVRAIIGIIIIILIFTIPSDALFRTLGFAKTFGTGIYEETFPVKVFDFMKTNNVAELGSKPFQTLDNGGYFLWNFPGKKNFIDSRNLNDSIWNSMYTVFNKMPGLGELLKQYDFDYFISFQPLLPNNPQQMDRNIVSYLSSQTDVWKLIYWDEKSMLFVKNNDNFKDLISKFEYKYFTPYNLFFRTSVIKNALDEKSEEFKKELDRVNTEAPGNPFLQRFLQTFGKRK